MIQMHHVDFPDQLTAAGDYRIVTNQNKCYPVIVCPKCLHPGSCSAHTMVFQNPLTIRASFLCSCGWHGWVTEGTMVEWTTTPSEVTLPSGAILDPSTGMVRQ